MQSNKSLKWLWKLGWVSLCLLFCLNHTQSQSFTEALKAGQTIKIEWIQQKLKASEGRRNQASPLFPDELKPGEAEVRVGLNLRSTEAGKRLIAEVAYVNCLAFSALEESPYYSNTTDLLSPPLILDTRFQDSYFNPLLFLLDALTGKELPISCDEGIYQEFLNQFAQELEDSITTSNLVKGQLEWLQESALPSSLSASSMAAFFCQLKELAIPKQESPIEVQTRRLGDVFRIDYVEADHPSKLCVFKGTIGSPATDQVRVKFFREGNWLEYWRDSTIQLDEKGSFQLSFPLDHSRMVSLFHGYQTMRFYMEPGDTIEFSTNANAFYREMEIQGSAQIENEFLLDFYHQMRGDTLFRRYDHDLLEKDHVAYFQKLKDKEAKEITFLAQRASSLRSGFTNLMDRMLKLEYATTEWEAAYRFMSEKRIVLEPKLLLHVQKKANLLYRLPRGKTFDFDVEEFLILQYYLLQNAYQLPRMGGRNDFLLAQLLPSKETFVRHAVMQLFRNYGDLRQLTESGQWRLSQLLSVTRDTQLLQEMLVFSEGNRDMQAAVGYRTLQRGKAAPSWSFEDKEGVKVGLEDFAGKKLLLHIGWADNLEVAMTDIQFLQEKQDQTPEIAHLLTASSKDQFNNHIADEKGLFIFVPPKEMETLKENYFIANSSNHYFLISEDGKILANHLDLGTTRKLQGTWEKIASLPPSTTWTAEQKLKFWQTLGIGALCLLVVFGTILWQRRIVTRRDLRRRQLLEIELRGIRSQMNPHFLFNAMSSIQNLIRKEEQEKADLYLGQFAGLMRKTLRNTAEEYIPLTDEIDTLEQYCSLESLRHPFQYHFQVDGSIDIHNTYIPSMILQPIIENAIIHGLAPQEGARKLLVQIDPGQEGLKCTIKDNGIGILASQKHTIRKNHKSVGMKLVRQRLELMGLDGQEHLSIIDRSTLNPPAQGTLVSLTIPVEQ
ncbi:MAG: histidine kinase [Bacteroidota bacterium]